MMPILFLDFYGNKNGLLWFMTTLIYVYELFGICIWLSGCWVWCEHFSICTCTIHNIFDRTFCSSLWLCVKVKDCLINQATKIKGCYVEEFKWSNSNLKNNTKMLKHWCFPLLAMISLQRIWSV